jgi:hypothetical protein
MPTNNIEFSKIFYRLNQLQQEIADIQEVLVDLEESGGGGLLYLSESKNTSAPNTSIPVVQLIPTSSESNIDLVLSPKGSGGLLAQTPDNTAIGGNKRAAGVVDLQMSRYNRTQVAAGSNSFIGSGKGNEVRIGDDDGDSDSSVIVGGMRNAIEQSRYSIIGGGAYNFIPPGGWFSTIPGGNGAYTRGTYGQFAYASKALADASNRGPDGLEGFTVGTSQWGVLPLAGITTDGTANLILRSGGADIITTAGNGSINSYLSPNMSYVFNGTVVARDYASTSSAGWEFKGVARKGATDATIAFVGTPSVSSLGANSEASSWAVGVNANTSSGCVEIRVTGQASKTIHWSAVMYTTEVI